MTNSDYDDFVGVLGMVYTMYDKTPNAPTLQLWWNLLKDFELNVVKKGFEAHLSNPDRGQYLPKPADILRQLEGSTLDLALLAWSKVDHAVKTIGPYKDIVFDDPIIHAVIHDMGGWIGLGDKTLDEWPFVGNEFHNRYKGYKNKIDLINYPSVLTGIANKFNLVENFKSLPPVFFGNENKCLAVMNKGFNNKSITDNVLAFKTKELIQRIQNESN